MLFPTHIIIAIPLIHIFDLSSTAIIIGCVLPDIVDKQLPKLDLTDYYHNILHSGITLSIIFCFSLIHPNILSGLVLGLTSHIIMDIVHVILNKRYKHTLFILWPVKFDPDPLNIPPGKFVMHYVGSLSFYFEFVIWFVCLYLVYIKFI